MKAVRKIIKINEDKCDGCGICANACHEGAIAMVDGKAKLISDSYCDGLGDCIGECPRGAITFEERPADAYDEVTVKARMAAKKADAAEPLACGCPGSMARSLPKAPAHRVSSEAAVSELANWPVQLKLVPVSAPYLKNASLLMAADCTAFAYPDFHSELLHGKVCLIGCPKLDDVEFYKEKLIQIIRENGIRSIEVVYMEVPCCGGLVRLVKEAIAGSKALVPLKLIKISVDGQVIDSRWD